MELEFYFGFSLAGVILGLGAATTILLLGVLSLRKHYWFHILNGTDKVTIPMLWVGALFLTIALILGHISGFEFHIPLSLKAFFLTLLTINGSYLTFKFAPVIRRLENDGKSTFLTLPMPHQVLIFIAGGIAGFSWTAEAFMLWLEVINNIWQWH